MKNISITTIYLFLSFLFLQAQDIPSEKHPQYKLEFSKGNKLARMDEGRYGMGYTTDGKYIYAMYGRSSNTKYITKSERYDIANNSWTKYFNNKTDKRFISAEYLNGKIYLFNGYNRDNSLNKKVEVIDTSTGEVSYLKDNPAPVCKSGTAVWNDKIYVFGGTGIKGREIKNHYHNQFYLFDTLIDTWTLLGVIPEHKHTTGAIVDGILYTFGGYNNHELSSIHSYNIADSTWTYIGEAPLDFSSNAITKHGEFIWIVGSYNKTGLLAAFNTVTHKFNIIDANLLGRKHAGAIVVDDKLYVFGGVRGVGLFIQAAELTEIEELLSK